MKNMILTLSLMVLGSLAAVPGRAAEGDPALAGGTLSNAFSSWGRPSLQGDWKIVQSEGAYFIELGENFKAKEGPDVKIFLSPTPADEVTGDNAVDGSVLVQQIADFDGRARITIPAGTDISQFQSLVFHCEAYSKLWGTSALR